VPASSEGFAVESVIRLFGEIGGQEGILSYNDVWVDDSARLGELNRGFELAMMGATRGRFYNTARSVGLSRWALERSVEYANVRRTMGKPIGEHQSIQNLLADCATEIYAARMMGLDCVRRAEAGQDVRREAAMAKLFATNAATRTFDRAMQIHGGMGLTNETRLHEG
jgi:acyl-CoA dehydrogenase